MASHSGAAFTRRGFFGVAGGAAAAGLLAACAPGGGGGGGGGGGAGELKFWNMPWGQTKFNPLDEEITLAYEPAEGLPDVSYQVIQWANFNQTFASAIASNTGPAVSSGGGSQAFQFEAQDQIAYADDLLESWKENGLYDDFLPGLIDTMKVERGYAAVPYNLDMRVIWYNQTLLEEAGTEPPTDWQSYLDACEALKKINVYGYGTAAGQGAFTGSHVLTSWMINNGGGLFDENQQPNCVTPQNIEAMEFVLEMVAKGYVDPASPTYTSANAQTQWGDRRFGLGWDTGGLANNVGGEVGPELRVNSPLESPNGTKGALFFPNNIMMYKNTPSKEGTEAFLTYYYQNMAPLWTEGTGIGLPPLKSITETEEFQADQNNVKIIEEWQPVARTWAAPGGDALFLGVTTVDATPAMDEFTQSILGGDTDARSALTTLQAAIEENLPS
jgi:multiple sugar transport system substrate-binding protein